MKVLSPILFQIALDPDSAIFFFFHRPNPTQVGIITIIFSNNCIPPSISSLFAATCDSNDLQPFSTLPQTQFPITSISLPSGQSTSLSTSPQSFLCRFLYSGCHCDGFVFACVALRCQARNETFSLPPFLSYHIHQPWLLQIFTLL